MKEYPSIPRDFQEFTAYVFDKYDGQNIRAEWTKKKGWHKFGSRHRLFDHTDPAFGPVIPLFQETIGDALAEIAKWKRWESLIVFAEYYGDKSFAGIHEPGDPMKLCVFDLNPYKQGILGPREFLKILGDHPVIETPKMLYHGKWTRGFVDRVWNNDLPGITFEGVVGKGGSGHDLVMAKAKTKQWIDKIHAKFPSKEAEQLANS